MISSFLHYMPPKPLLIRNRTAWQLRAPLSQTTITGEFGCMVSYLFGSRESGMCIAPGVPCFKLFLRAHIKSWAPWSIFSFNDVLSVTLNNLLKNPISYCLYSLIFHLTCVYTSLVSLRYFFGTPSVFLPVLPRYFLGIPPLLLRYHSKNMRRYRTRIALLAR